MKALALALASLLAACATVVPPRAPADFARLDALGVEDFPGAARVLSGFAPDDADPEVRVGDAVLLGLSFHRAERVERQLLLLEVRSTGRYDVTIGGKTTSGRTAHEGRVTTTRDGEAPEQRNYKLHPVYLGMRRFDAAGQVLGEADVQLYEEALATGFWPDTEPQPSLRDLDLSFLLAMTLQNVADSDGGLRDLILFVADVPSLWSIATHLGVKVTLLGETREAATAAPHGPVRAVRKELWVNGDPALWVDLRVQRPTGATILCGGVLGAVGMHPTNAERYLVAKLLATRRGAPRP